jgi:hypothetical protein
MSNAERMRLEEYLAATQAFNDSLKGFNSATEEARLRCEKARLAWVEARTAYEREKVERARSYSLALCPELYAIEEEYVAAVIAYGDAANGIQLPSRIVDEQESEKIERARIACNAVFKALENHVRLHRCGKSAKAGST